MADLDEALSAIAEHGRRAGTLPHPSAIRRRGDRRHRRHLVTAWGLGLALAVAGLGAIASGSGSRDDSARPMPSASDRQTQPPSAQPSRAPDTPAPPTPSPTAPSASPASAPPTTASPLGTPWGTPGPGPLPDKRRYRLVATGGGFGIASGGGGDMVLALDPETDGLYLAPPETTDSLAWWTPLPSGDQYMIMLGVPRAGGTICVTMAVDAGQRLPVARGRPCAPGDATQLFTIARVGTTQGGEPTYSLRSGASYLGVSNGSLVATPDAKRAAGFVFAAA